jgi:hypothetical protein
MNNAEVENLEIFCALSNLDRITLNSVNGPSEFPDCLFDKAFERFHFLNMDFEGQAIPDQLGNIPSLNSINLTDSNFGGEIPESLCNQFDNFQFFVASENQLSGNLPSCFPCPNFVQLIISDCGLEGEFNLDNITDEMSILRCNGNTFTGNLESLKPVPRLGSFEFGDSKLTGTLDGDKFGELFIIRIILS